MKENNSQIIETSIIIGQVNVSFCISEETVADCETRVSKSGRLPEEHLLWIYWNYPTYSHLLYQHMNLRAAQEHKPHMTVLRVNDSNVKDFIPDLPEEWFRLYNQARSDVLRAGLLYHHGGMYMDTDVLVRTSLDQFTSKVRTHDIVSYQYEHGDENETRCINGFSSNIMAARKQNAYSETWWNNMKVKLTRTCTAADYGIEKVCCHEEGSEEADTRVCHIPWAFLEVLKTPHLDPDLKYKDDNETNLASLALAKQLPDNIQLYCIHATKSFTPGPQNGEIYWLKWNNGSDSCQPIEDGGLRCPKYEVQSFFNRTAYHLFFSIYRDQSYTNSEQLLNSNTVIGELYRRIYNITELLKTKL